MPLPCMMFRRHRTPLSLTKPSTGRRYCSILFLFTRVSFIFQQMFFWWHSVVTTRPARASAVCMTERRGVCHEGDRESCIPGLQLLDVFVYCVAAVDCYMHSTANNIEPWSGNNCKPYTTPFYIGFSFNSHRTYLCDTQPSLPPIRVWDQFLARLARIQFFVPVVLEGPFLVLSGGSICLFL